MNKALNYGHRLIMADAAYNYSIHTALTPRTSHLLCITSPLVQLSIVLVSSH